MLRLALLPLVLYSMTAAQGPSCPPCSVLKRSPLGHCACGACLPGYEAQTVGMVVQAQCLAVDVCQGQSGTAWDGYAQACRACPTSFLTVDCQSCDSTDCTACELDEYYNASATGCTARYNATDPALLALQAPSAELDDRTVRVWTPAQIAALTRVPSAIPQAWTAMLVAAVHANRQLPDANGNVFGPDGRLWPLSQVNIARRCGPGHYAVAYLSAQNSATAPCSFFVCSSNTSDTDDNALTPCRRFSS